MKNLLLLGGGGHCRSVIDVIETAGSLVIRGIIQPKADGDRPVLGYPVIGDDDALPALLAEGCLALVTVGQIKSPVLRRRLFERLKAMSATLPVVISPHAYVSRHASLGEGSVVMHGAVVNAGVVLGANGIVNSLTLLEHDAKIGDHCHISTGARVNGGARIADGCFIGSGAIIAHGIAVGPECVVGAGCVVTQDLPGNTLVKAAG